MTEEMDYFAVFDVEGTAPGGAPDHGDEAGSREGSAARREEKSGDEDGHAGESRRKTGRPQSAEENAQFAAQRRARQRRPSKKQAVLDAAQGLDAAAGEDDGALKPQEALEHFEAAQSPEPPTRTLTPAPEAAGSERTAPQGQAEPAVEALEDGEDDFAGQLRQLRQAEAAARAERDYAVDRSIRMRIEGEIREIGRLDPAVRSLEDIRRAPDYGRIGALVQGGVSLVDAYKLVHFDRLTENAAAGARQAALNARSGKSHLQRVDGTGGDMPCAVPEEVLQAYRAIMPELSAREIEKHYHAYRKG